MQTSSIRAIPLIHRVENRIDEFDDLVALLNDYRSDDSQHTSDVILWMANACMGNNHLWQDMGLASREVLSQLIQKHFHALFIKNVDNMKWKKFFYRQLCERADIQICKSPSCKVCVDYQLCFGPELACA